MKRIAEVTQAVIYTRVSPSPKTRADKAASRQGLSLEAQLAICREHATRKGYSIIGEFTDQAISGKDTIEKRPGLQSVLQLAAKRDDVAVIVYSLSRLSRRQSLTWRLLDDRGDYQLAVESATEPFDTSSPIGRAMMGMLAVWAQLEADMCSERTSAALEARRASGQHVGARPLVQDNPSLVQEIKLLYASGKFTMRTLADHLNAENIPTKFGKRWHSTTVARTLRQSL
jgi:site-specific DNA recombinase